MRFLLREESCYLIQIFYLDKKRVKKHQQREGMSNVSQSMLINEHARSHASIPSSLKAAERVRKNNVKARRGTQKSSRVRHHILQDIESKVRT